MHKEGNMMQAQFDAAMRHKRLLKMMLADAEFWTYGALRPAFETALETRDWLSSLNPANLGDCEVSPFEQESA